MINGLCIFKSVIRHNQKNTKKKGENKMKTVYVAMSADIIHKGRVKQENLEI